MEQAGREDWMLRKGKEDEREVIGGAKGKDWGIHCFILYSSHPPLSRYSSLPPFTRSPALVLSLSARVPGHFGLHLTPARQRHPSSPKLFQTKLETNERCSYCSECGALRAFRKDNTFGRGRKDLGAAWKNNWEESEWVKMVWL